MGLNRLDIIKQINLYSSEDNKEGLISILCKILENEEFKEENLDLIQIIISIGELYGYYTYVDSKNTFNNVSENIREKLYLSYDGSIHFNSGQLSLLNEIKNNKKIFISAPTTFGKTKIVLEFLMSEYKKLNNILFIIPTNSLSEELYTKLLKFNRIINHKFNISANPTLKGSSNILILTPEKYLLLLESKNPNFDLYVMDESYKVESGSERNIPKDPLNSRSSKFRRVMNIIASQDSKCIFLSPFTYQIDESMNRFFKKYNITKVDRRENYVEKTFYKVEDSDDFKNIFDPAIKGYWKDLGGVRKASFIVNRLEGSTIIYVRHPKDAADLISLININKNVILDNNLRTRFEKFLSHLEENYEFDDSKWYILDALKKGVGIYVSPMPRYIKREIVELFNKNVLNVLIVTTAFAEGVNSSAKNVIITNDVAGSNVKMTTLDLLNLSGRAGRFGVHVRGNVYSVKENIHKTIREGFSNGVKISNILYENADFTKPRDDYDLEQVDSMYLSELEILNKKSVESFMEQYDINFDDLNIALSISNYNKMQLYKHFNEDQEKTDERREIINKITSNEKNEVVKSISYIFDDIYNAQIKIAYDEGDMPAYTANHDFLWGKFYAIHANGNMKEILKSRKKYITNTYNDMKKDITASNSWVNEFISDGMVDNFKLYNHAFKFISSIIEYRIPFYISFYISIFNLYCKKNMIEQPLSFDIVEISNSLENKKLDEKYESLLEYGFPLDMINKIIEAKGSLDTLDDYEKIIYEEYVNLMSVNDEK